LENANPAERLSGLDQVKADSPAGQALVAFMAAGEEARNGAPEAAAKRLDAVAAQSDLPLIYRQMAMFKSLTFQSDTSDVATRRIGFETLAVPGSPLRLLATEQLALIDIQQGETTAAIDRLQALVLDAEVTAGLRRRASQLIVALGGEVSPPSFGTTTADQ